MNCPHVYRAAICIVHELAAPLSRCSHQQTTHQTSAAREGAAKRRYTKWHMSCGGDGKRLICSTHNNPLTWAIYCFWPTCGAAQPTVTGTQLREHSRRRPKHNRLTDATHWPSECNVTPLHARSTCARAARLSRTGTIREFAAQDPIEVLWSWTHAEPDEALAKGTTS